MTSSSRGGRSVAAVNAIVSVGLVVVLAGVALVVKPPAPPGIAEFAPQASKPITKAPLGQTGGVGSQPGPGACASTTACATPNPTTSATSTPVPVPTRARGVASTKQCYAWPDGSVTQTWDPQSPPCIADWPERARGNGGATFRGVTATSIRVAVPWGESFDEKKPLVDFFNNRFELYGRRLVLTAFDPQSRDDGNAASDAAAERADAEAAKSLNPFAAIANPFGQANPKTYTSRLAAAGIVTVAGGGEVTVGSERQLSARSPYAWTYEPTSDELLATIGTMTCRQLVGRPASRSSDPSIRARTRTFAIVVPDEDFLPGHLDGVEQLQDQLAACGAGRPRVVEYRRPTTGDPSPTVLAMRQLQTENVTSIILWPHHTGAASPGAPQKAASGLGYHPEWIFPGWSVHDSAALTAGAVDEVPNSFGVASWSPIPRLTDRPFYRAFSETTGGQPPEVVSTQGDAYQAFYRYLQVIASGVQLAGPNLTPQRFEDALQSARFPNPGAGTRPDYQANVGYADDHVAVDDFAFFWFNPRARPYTGTVEADPLCYGQRARRWSSLTWPEGGDPFANGTC